MGKKSDEKSQGKSREKLSLYDEMNVQLHSAKAQLTEWQLRNQQLTKENEILQQKNTELTRKVDELTKQIQKQSETIKVITEEKKKTTEGYNKLQQQLEEKKEEVARLTDKISFLRNVDKDLAIRTDHEEKYYRLYLKLRDIVYDEKIDDWVASSWRYMERLDFKAFVGDLRSVFEEEERLG
jgi:chromosome segregation ATPase